MRLLLALIIFMSFDADARKCPYYGYFVEINYGRTNSEIHVSLDDQSLGLKKLVKYRGKFYLVGWTPFPESRHNKTFCRPPVEAGIAFYECDGQRMEKRLVFAESRSFDKISSNPNFLANDKLTCPKKNQQDRKTRTGDNK